MFLDNYKRALEVILKKPIMLWGLSLLAVVVATVSGVLTAALPFLSIGLGYLFTCGQVKLYMDGLEGKEVDSKQLFAAFNQNWLKTASAMAWQGLWNLIWGFVPVMGIIKSYSYKFVPYIIMTNPEISAFDALKISMKMTEGKKKQMFLADLVFMAAPMVANLILGLFAAIPLIGGLFGLASLLVNIAVFLFGTIFSGLYQASFFDKNELAQYTATAEPEVVA